MNIDARPRSPIRAACSRCCRTRTRSGSRTWTSAGTENGSTGRITLSDHTLITTDVGTRTERTLTDIEALDTYRTVFGITLDHLPTAPTG